jgi:CDP-6-deoxy-D-xylo-4-hexulose-3-dehydrase
MSEPSWPLMKNNISREDLNAIISYLSLDDPKLTHGPKVKEFEEQWSKWLGVKFSVMVNSGSSANDLTMLALKKLRGAGEVIVPPLTWVSDIASVMHAGHTPIFVDINPKNLAIDEELLLQAITPRTKAVFLTHVLGFDGLTDRIIEELASRNIPLIEDVCESHGGTHNGQKLGSIGWVSNFSFYYAHHLTTIEGGMVSTNDPGVYDWVRMMRSHGMVRESSDKKTHEIFQKKYPDLNPDFIFAAPSHNMRPTEINGLLGLEQLKNLDSNNIKRAENFKYFLSSLNNRLFRTDFNVNGNSNYAFTLVLNNPDVALRDRVESILKEKRIEFRRGLSGGGNQLRQPYLAEHPQSKMLADFTNVDHVHFFGWYIGNYPSLKLNEIDFLVNTINSVDLKI